MALVATTTSVWALETDGDGAYLIGSVQDWKDFATLVQSNPTANAKMTSDIDLGDDQTMIGTSAHPYQGTFNGQRHTLTVNLNTSLTNTAPFSYVGTGAVIKRLVIDGTIRSTAEYLSGVVGQAQGAVTLDIIQVNATIRSGEGTAGDQYLGGLVGLMSGANVTINDCLFCGVQNSTRCTSAIAGYGSGSIAMNNSLLMGTYSGQNMHPICHSGLGFSGSNNYLCMTYNQGSVPEEVTTVTRERIATGEIAHLLQEAHGDLEQIWGQDLANFSTIPVLTFDPSLRVYSNGDGMYSNDSGLPTHNAYAIWCASNKTLYFDYTDIGLTAGDTYKGETVTTVWSGSKVVASSGTGVPDWYSNNPNVEKVVFDENFVSMKPISLFGWFSNCTALESITGMEYLNTSRALTMESMFQNCSNLSSIDVTHFNTSGVSSMAYMFLNCGITDINVDNFDVSNVGNFERMFCNCTQLRAIYVNTGWGPISASISNEMFRYSEKLVGDYALIDHTGWNSGVYFNYYITPTERASALAQVFYCRDNKTLYFDYSNRYLRKGHLYDGHEIVTLSTFDAAITMPNTSSWRNAYYSLGGNTIYVKNECTNAVITEAFHSAELASAQSWFEGMAKLATVTGINNLNLTGVTDMSRMFKDCGELSAVDLSTLNTSAITNMGNLFYNCSSLSSVNLTGTFSTENVTNMYCMFYGCSSLETLDLSNFNTEQVTNTSPNYGMLQMFYNCSSLESLDLSNFNTSLLNRMDNMFKGCSSLESINLSSFNTEQVIYMANMFDGCSSLTSINLSNFNTEKVTDMSYMFQGCSGLTSINLNNFNTEKVVNTAYMFQGCNGLTSLDLSNFNTPLLIRMEYMFKGCSKLTSLDLSNFTTTSVTHMLHLFEDCTLLASVNLSSFNTGNVIDMTSMFEDCSSLEALDIHNFAQSKNPTVNRMFYGCSSLESITCDGTWTVGASYQGENVFYGCTALKGCIYYDPSKVSHAYANPMTGYFTPSYAKGGDVLFAVVNGSAMTLYSGNGIGLPAGAHIFTGEDSWNSSFRTSISTISLHTCCSLYTGTTLSNLFNSFNLTSISGLNNLRTDDVTNMSRMFYHFGQNNATIKTLDLSSFNTAKVTTMSHMFDNCQYLESLDLSSFNTANVTDMSYMFYYCIRMSSPNLTSFNTEKVTTMSNMFSWFNNSDTAPSYVLDLSSFNTSAVEDMSRMFNTNKLRTIIVSDDWNTGAVTSTDYIFICNYLIDENGSNCGSAVGGVEKAYVGDGGYLVSNNLYDAQTNTNKINRLKGLTIGGVKLKGRTLKAGKWNSLCVPFNISEEQLAAGPLAGALVRTLDSYTNDGTTVTITLASEASITAHKPYLVFIPDGSDIVDPVFPSTTVTYDNASVLTTAQVTKGDATFIGAYTPQVLTAGDQRKLFLQDNKLYYPSSEATVSAYRAYFTLTADVPLVASGAPCIVLDFGDGTGSTTGIADLSAGLHQTANTPAYNLNGQRVLRPRQGIFIVNGKKVFIK